MYNSLSIATNQIITTLGIAPSTLSFISCIDEVSAQVAGAELALPPMKNPGVVAIGKRTTKAIRTTATKLSPIFQTFTMPLLSEKMTLVFLN
tara:strand:- start:791 stop:1066 length:276 start_codon:yes stop_codon:yes gene_type:complete